MLHPLRVVLFSLLILLAACARNSRNQLPSVVEETRPSLEVTEEAVASAVADAAATRENSLVDSVDAGFATAEPLVVERVPQESVPALDTDEIAPALVSEARAITAANDTIQQQLVMSEMIGLILERYVDESVNNVDWAAVLEDYQNDAELQRDWEFWRTMAETLALLEDSDAFYMSPPDVQAYEQMIRGNQGNSGVGVVTVPQPATRDVLIAWAIEGNGAYAAGVRSGDRLLAIDGRAVCCDQTGMMFQGLRGAADSTVRLTIQRGNEAQRTLTVSRQPLMLQQTVSRRRVGSVGIITIHSFVTETAAKEVWDAWSALNVQGGMSGLVIDIRPNTGGFEQQMTETLRLFADGNAGVYRSRQGAAPLVIAGQDIHNSQTIPMAILIGEATGSQAEIFAGVLQQFGRATLIGSATQGNVTSIFPHDLADGARVWLPEDRFELRDGSSWSGTGLVPDIEIAQAWSDIGSDEDDPALAAALVRLRNR